MGEEGEEGEARGRKMRKRRRRRRMGGRRRRRRGPWVVKLEVRGEGVRGEEGGAKTGDAGRGSGERD